MNDVILTLNMSINNCQENYYIVQLLELVLIDKYYQKIQLNKSKAKYSHCYEFCMP